LPKGSEGPFPTFLCIRYPHFPVSPLAQERPPWYEKAKPKIAEGLDQVAYVIGRGYAFAWFRANEAADHRFDKGIYPHYRPTSGKLVPWRYGGAGSSRLGREDGVVLVRAGPLTRCSSRGASTQTALPSRASPATAWPRS
jgi:hypothetical protein